MLRRGRAGSQPAQTNGEYYIVSSTAHSFDGMVTRLDHFEMLDRTGDVMDLTSGKFRLLNVFLQNPKRVLSRNRLKDLLNGADWSPFDRTIDN